MYVIMVNHHAWSELMVEESLVVDPQPQFLSVFTQWLSEMDFSIPQKL